MILEKISENHYFQVFNYVKLSKGIFEVYPIHSKDIKYFTKLLKINKDQKWNEITRFNFYGALGESKFF